MPLLEIEAATFIHQAEKLAAEGSAIGIPKLAKQCGVEFLGRGRDSFVFVLPSDPTKVVAATYRNPDRSFTLRNFYSQRIYSTLFPDVFPRVHAILWRSEADKNYVRVYGTIRERVFGRICGSPEDQLTKQPSLRERISEMFGKRRFRSIFSVMAICWENDIPLLVDAEPSNNSLVTNDGRICYVDQVGNFPSDPDELRNVLRFMQKGYTVKEKHTVISCFNMLIAAGQLSRCVNSNTKG